MKGKFILGMPFIEVELEEAKIPALFDTGFNGWLAVPESVASKLNLEEAGIADYLAATGERKTAKLYKGKVKIFGEEKEIAVVASQLSFAIAGLSLFHLCKITIERHKDVLEIEKSVKTPSQ